jgi:hypothetical protein
VGGIGDLRVEIGDFRFSTNEKSKIVSNLFGRIREDFNITRA